MPHKHSPSTRCCSRPWLLQRMHEVTRRSTVVVRDQLSFSARRVDSCSGATAGSTVIIILQNRLFTGIDQDWLYLPALFALYEYPAPESCTYAHSTRDISLAVILALTEKMSKKICTIPIHSPKLVLYSIWAHNSQSRALSAFPPLRTPLRKHS